MKKYTVIFCIGLFSTYAFAQKNGQKVYSEVCSTCHDQGVFGAPKLGDVREWTERVSKGQSILDYNSIEGFAGKKGFMPPRGGDSSLTDDEVKSAVQYMINQSW